VQLIAQRLCPLSTRCSADVLDVRVEDAAEFFKVDTGVRDKMRMLLEVGLGLHQGRPTGDYAQRRRGAKGQTVEAPGRFGVQVMRYACGARVQVTDDRCVKEIPIAGRNLAIYDWSPTDPSLVRPVVTPRQQPSTLALPNLKTDPQGQARAQTIS
jgi:hypothetical protein